MSLENIFSLLSLLVAAAAAAGALYSVILSRNTAENSRKMTRKQATLDFIEKHEIDSASEFSKFLPALLQKKDIWSDPAYVGLLQPFITFLGRYEKIALGLKHEIYDDQMVFDSLAVDVVRMYDLSEPFIMQTREKMRMITSLLGSSPKEEEFSDFELLAKKYKARLAQK